MPVFFSFFFFPLHDHGTAAAAYIVVTYYHADPVVNIQRQYDNNISLRFYAVANFASTPDIL